MSVTYELIERIGPGLVVLRRISGRQVDQAVWDRTSIRKPHRCAVNGVDVKPPAKMYRPVGNQSYRYERISAPVIDGSGS